MCLCSTELSLLKVLVFYGAEPLKGACFRGAESLKEVGYFATAECVT